MVEVDPEYLFDGPTLCLVWPDLTPSKLRVWVHRGRLQRRGRDWWGRSLYRWADVRALVDATNREDGVP